MPRTYRSITTQSLHYFARPHTSLPDGPIQSPAAWRGDELARDGRWIEELSAADQDALDRALSHARRSKKPLAQLRAGDLPLPGFEGRIAEWRRAVSGTLGMLVLRGVPVERWSTADSERFFWCFGQHLGRPGVQNRDGELLGHVRDQGASYEDATVRGYKTSAALAYHTDAADAVGLLCLSAAKAGGRSRFVSSVTVWNELWRQDPALALRLFERFTLDTRGDGGIDYVDVPPCRHADGALRTFYHGDYFRTASQHPGAPRLSAAHREALDAFDAIANTPGIHLELDFAPGDIQLLSNHTVMHSRTEYIDGDEPEAKRHLLRLWLSFDVAAPPWTLLSRGREVARLLASAARGRVMKRLAGSARRTRASAT